MNQQPPSPQVAALVVTYFPDDRLADRLDRLVRQVDRLWIVDNGSDAMTATAIEAYADHDAVTLHRNEDNLGIATALNLGLTALAAEGYDWVFTMDQDSEVAPGCIAALTRVVEEDPDSHDIALVGSNRRDAGTEGAPHRWLRPRPGFPFFERVTCDRIGRDGVTLVITSGTMIRVAAFQRLGPFRDDFFIDFVDFEYCLRARNAGYRILVSCDSYIAHRVGTKRTSSGLGVTLSPTHHEPLRKYYLFRNGVVTIRRYGRSFPYWLFYQFLAMLEVVIGIVLSEQRKRAKLRACALGAWDGLRGRMGPARRHF